MTNKPSYRLLRMAVKAHRNRDLQRKWLRAVDALGDKWILAKPLALSKDERRTA